MEKKVEHKAHDFYSKVESYKNQMESYYRLAQSKNPELVTEARAAVVFQESPREGESSEEEYELYKEQNTKIGYLKAEVSTARKAIPIANAVVTINKKFSDGIHQIAQLTTDVDGITQVLPLPAPDKSLSTQPGSSAPYSTFDVVVTRDGYQTMYYYNVPVFEGVLSIQPVNLTPNSMELDANSKIIYEREPSDL